MFPPARYPAWQEWREESLAARTTGARQAQAVRRREQLLDVAFTLFAERGYRATSVRDITRAAGVTEAVLYHYFGNKADLLAAVLEVYAPFAGYRRILDAADSTPVEAVLLQLGGEFLRLLRERRVFVLTLLSEAASDPEISVMLGRLLDDVVGAVGSFIDTRHTRDEAGKDTDGRAVGKALQGGLLIHFLSHQSGQDSDEEDAIVVDRIVTALLPGITPRR